MITTANLVELYQIIDSQHGDPHHILGMHEMKLNGKNVLTVRAFIPQAEKITVRDLKDKNNVYEMNLIHEDGFFECIIQTRSELFKYVFDIEGHGSSWTIYDPYSFDVVLSELDLYLFGEGNHYEIYNKLGAHVTTIDGVSGVLFAVWAPNAKRVSVIGDFNSWDGRRNPMRILKNSGIWELFVPEIGAFEKYKFEIKANDGSLHKKSDPYANFAELRPDTASVVYDINQYQWNDEDYLKQRDVNATLDKPMNVYEVHLGSWKRGEDNRFLTYRELAKELVSYVKEMNYTHIELMPVEEHPFDGSWGYQVTGYFAPTSRYGQPEDFMFFVDECHKHNIGIILDWVPAHFPKDAHGLARFDGTALYEHADPKKGEHPDWGTYIFNYGRNEVKNFLIANAIFWIEKYHLDGLRVDAVASMLYLDYGKNEGGWIPNQYGGRENLEAVEFMKHMNSIIASKYPSALMIAEESTAWAGVSKPTKENGLGFNLKWNMGWMNDFLRYISKEPIHRKYHHNDLTFSMVYAYTENFVLVLSHDEVVHGKGAMINKMPGDLWQKFANARVAYGFMFSHPGKKLLFMGSEFGQFAEWNEAKSLDWHLLQYEHHTNLHQYMKELNNLYVENEILWNNDFNSNGFEWIDCDDNEKSLVSFMRKSTTTDDFLIVLCNFTPTTYTGYRIGVPIDGEYEEIFNSDSQKYGGSGIVNEAIMVAEEKEWNHRELSIGIDVPPLGISIIKPVRKPTVNNI